jgi:plasmid stabilization system protein ParE
MPRRLVELHPEALNEARMAYQWYYERNPSAAAALLAEIDRAIEKITESPERWPQFLHGTHRFILQRFPFSLVYRVLDAVIYVVAFAHGRRRPGYWRKR